MNVLLTGATGYVGHQLALTLAENKFKVHALVRDLGSFKVPKHDNITLFQGDICDYLSILKAIENCDYVFHTAAYTNLKCRSIENFYSTNVVGTENLLKAALHHQVKKVIYTSTLSTYGPSYKQVPIIETQPRIASYANDYELTKSMSEEIVYSYFKKGLSCIILNVSKVYGPGLATFSNGVNRLISMFDKNDFLIVPNRLQSTSNYVFIKDVINAHLLAMQSSVKFDRYIIGGENVSYKQLFTLVKNLTKSRIRIVKINYKVIRTIFSISSFFHALINAAPSITPRILDSLFVNRISSSKKAQKELNYQPTTLEVGLQETIQFLKLSS
ncbi:NAD-dependent epimerase/dehydratase family protein [Litoribaculum gwangyangense]|uniref:SDR family oxidoreductase n=1 Tax=Litoribaculum gwangyangense TaxID=1130722 RepID=A0ABP9CKR3_9FLAO